MVCSGNALEYCGAGNRLGEKPENSGRYHCLTYARCL